MRLEPFEQMNDRYAELSEAIIQPEIIADTARYQACLKELAGLEEAVNAYRRYRSVEQELRDAGEMLADPELAEEAEAELEALRAEQNSLEENMKLLLLPKDPDDERNVILEIRAGAGGEEAALFGADLMRLYTHYADRHGLRVEPVSLSDTELGGIKEAVFCVTGKGAWAAMKYESGVHRVQRVPVTDSTGKKQTSTCTVAVLPEAEAVELEIDPKDVRIDVYRSTGHGGQCVNTTDSAVRITHLPTGLVATCQDQKSQIKNREQAMKVLRSRLLEKLRTEADTAYAENRRSQVGTGDRSERIRTYNFHESRVTDHRIGLTIYRIGDVMNGDLDEFVEALKRAEQEKLLARQNGGMAL